MKLPCDICGRLVPLGNDDTEYAEVVCKTCLEDMLLEE